MFDYHELFNDLNKEKPVEMSKMPDYMIGCARKRTRPVEGAMNDWLEWNIDLFDKKFFLDGQYLEHFEECQKNDPDYFNMTATWFNEMYRSWVQNDLFLDMFGTMYEMAFKSGQKASATGQFFTPCSLATMMGELTLHEHKDGECVAISDCCCGSGRLLLGAIQKFGKDTKQFYVAQDLDHTSVMMTALNIMAHNRHALVMGQDTLMLSEPHTIILVNEVDYPYQTGFMSITKLTTEEAHKRGWLSIDGDDVKTYVPIPGNYERICNLPSTLSDEQIKSLLPS